jgi:hypothetical protein
VTNTCCLDCSRKPCPVGANCRDSATMGKWCGRKTGKAVDFKEIVQAECVGDCEEFSKEEEKK